MSFDISMAVRNSLLTQLKTDLDLGKIIIYDDAVAMPASASDAVPVGANVLVEITNNSTTTGLTFDAPASGILSKSATEIWSGVISLSGTASWYRFVAVGDTGASSTTEARVQGSVGTVAEDLIVANTLFVAAESQKINSYVIALPESK